MRAIVTLDDRPLDRASYLTGMLPGTLEALIERESAHRLVVFGRAKPGLAPPPRRPQAE